MMWVQDPNSTTVPTSNGIEYTVDSVEYALPPRAEVTLDKDELDNPKAIDTKRHPEYI